MTNDYLIEIDVPYIERAFELWASPELTAKSLKELLLEAIDEKRRGYIPAGDARLYIQGADRCLREEVSIGNQGVTSGMRLVLV